MRLTPLLGIVFGLVLQSFFVVSTSLGQSTMGGWTQHTSTSKVNEVLKINNMLYATYTGGVLEYDLTSKEKTLLNSVNGLSDLDITSIGAYQSTLIVGYENGNLDLFDGATTTNVPAIRLAQLQGSKRINQILAHKKHVYIATGFGIVKLDPVKMEIVESYFPGTAPQNIYGLCIWNDSIYATNGSVMYAGALSNPVLSDPASWKIDTRFETSKFGTYTQVLTLNQKVYFLKSNENYGGDTVYTITNSNREWVSNLGFELEINSLSTHENRLAINLADGLLCFKSDLSGIQYGIGEYQAGKRYNINSSLFVDNQILGGDELNGLFMSNLDGVPTWISYPGPPKNSFYKLAVDRETLIVSGGGLSGVQNTFNAAGNYVYNSGSWTLLDRNTVSAWSNKTIYDFMAASINPKNGHFAIATYSHEPISIFDESNNLLNIFNPFNSTLENTVLGNGNSYVSDVRYDSKGNLWVLNGYSVDGLLKCYDANGKWHVFSLGQASTGFRTEDMVVDYNGNVWSSVLGKGLYGFKHNNTLDVITDDKVVNLTVNENGGALPSNTVTALAVDFDNEIWIGTESGFAILYNSNSSFDAAPGEYNAQRIKIEFEGNVEFLLGSTFISAIEVDGGNRKWIGTGGAGIFCLSPDGLEVLYHFTAENSPLLSDNIVDMKFDHKTGELYIITDKGLISTRIDASYGDQTYSDVRVFPNPVEPNYFGPITIQGIQFDSDVKITDAGGNLVYQTTSNGGTATWNGKTLNGEEVASGVYFIWTAPNSKEAEGRKVGKVAVVR